MVMSALPRQQRRVEYVRVVGRGGGGERRQRRRVCLSKCEGRRSGERSANDVFTSWKSRDSKRLLFINPEAEKTLNPDLESEFLQSKDKILKRFMVVFFMSALNHRT